MFKLSSLGLNKDRKILHKRSRRVLKLNCDIVVKSYVYNNAALQMFRFIEKY